MPLNTHTVLLHTPRLHLRPMTDADWDTLLRWNQAQSPGGKARSTCDMRITQTEWAAGANPLA